ncbi:MAG: cysteine synthase family protein [Acidobacteria bacterium]|nr:cysteine synthase family protein [Acidobacteriota bacterium]
MNAKIATIDEARRRVTSPTAPLCRPLLDLIGNTPLVGFERIVPSGRDVKIYAKAEWFNPGGSVKDRAALGMIREGERTGQLRSGKIILDATSGNTGIAYAMIGAVRGYRVKLCVPANISLERKRILRAYNAELVFTDPLASTDGAIREAQRIFRLDPDRYFYPDQYSNEANWRAHYETTAREIWEQTEGRVTDFVAGLGTSGTFIGTSRRLKKLKPSIRAYSFQPDGPLHGLEGLKHMATAIVPAIYDPTVADENLGVTTEAAEEMVRRLAADEGLLVGISSGAALACCLEVAARVRHAVIVTIFPDSGAKYLSSFGDDDPTAETGNIEALKR